jgi:hypothetical protein
MVKNMKMWVLIGITVALLLAELVYVRNQNQVRVNEIAKNCSDWREQTIVYLGGTMTHPTVEENTKIVCVEKEVPLTQYYAKMLKK